MKLSAYSKQVGVSYRTAWRWFKAGNLPGYQTRSGTILVEDPGKQEVPQRAESKTAIHARVSSAENKSNLDGQANRLQDYCAAKGYPISAIVKEIGSGVNDARPKLQRLLKDPAVTRIVVEHKDRLTRFGFRYLESLLAMQGRRIEVINQVEDGKEDLVQDFVSIVTAFCARLYGQRRSKRKTERIIAELSAGHKSSQNSEQKGGDTHAAS